MQSGNFLIGRKGLSVKGFNEYFLPEFKKKECEIKDILALGDPEGILVSISGKNLEKKVEEIVKISSERVEKGYSQKSSAYNFQVGNYEILGVYDNEKTASMNFPLIAQPYLCKVASGAISRIEDKLRTLAKSTIANFGR